MLKAEVISAVAERMLSKSNRADFAGRARPEQIAKAEALLGVVFPSDYKVFLSELGCGSFDATEIYGIIPTKFPGEGIPSVVPINLQLRSEIGWPVDKLIIAHSGYGPWLCLALKNMNGPYLSEVELLDPSGKVLGIEQNSFTDFLASITE